MAGFGVREDDIALLLGISGPTLRKYYPSELRLGHIKANVAVAQSLYKKAIGSGPASVTAAIFWAKVRMGWKDTTGVEVSGQIAIRLENLTDAQLEQLLARISAGLAAGD
jgi:hypothetical protein